MTSKVRGLRVLIELINKYKRSFLDHGLIFHRSARNSFEIGLLSKHKFIISSTWLQNWTKHFNRVLSMLLCPNSTKSTHLFPGKNMELIDLLQSFGTDMGNVASALDIDIETLRTMDKHLLSKMLTQSNWSPFSEPNPYPNETQGSSSRGALQLGANGDPADPHKEFERAKKKKSSHKVKRVEHAFFNCVFEIFVENVCFFLTV